MSYTTPDFWILVAATLLGAALLPGRWRLPWLIAASLVFYAAPDAMRLVWLGAVWGLASVAMALMPAGRPWTVAGPAIAALVLLLVWAKFADAVGLPDPGGPPGLSFYIFTAIALVAEAARERARWGAGAALLHLAWFPKILAGPIERPQGLIPQFDDIALRPGPAALGVTLILSGLVKKLVIADNLAPVVDAAYAIPAYAAPMELLIATYFFAFQIYCDFSGYADIALGLSALAGLRLSRNFRHPYLSPTVGEFWSGRWHITLGHWFRDYVYIPLGGSRHGRLRKMANLLAVFTLSGLWHAGLGYGVGWGFLIWGLLNFAYVAAEQALPAKRPGLWRVLGILLTFHLVLVSWVFFRADSVSDALTILSRIATGLPEMPGLLANYPFTSAHALGAAMIAVLMGIEIAADKRPLAERLAAAPMILRGCGWYAALVLLLLIGRWEGAQFVYAQF